MTLNGCDISEWQGNINWDALAPSTDFVILRASYGGSYMDKQVRNYQQGAQGKLIGYYHFIHSDGSNTQQQAQFFLDCIGELKEGQPLFLDVEENFDNLESYVLDMAKFITDKTGIIPLLYMNHDFLNRYNWSELVKLGCGLWLAEWTNNPDVWTAGLYWSAPAFLQYTDFGTLTGINGRVDLDAFFGDAEDFKRYGMKEKENDLDDWIAIAYFNNYLQAWNPNAGICTSWMNELKNGRNRGIAVTLEYQDSGKTYQRFSAGLACWNPSTGTITWY